MGLWLIYVIRYVGKNIMVIILDSLQYRLFMLLNYNTNKLNNK